MIGWLQRLWRRTGRGAGATADAGRWGEEKAAALLAAKGYRILGRRVRVGRRDELDLVARDGAILVFVEVKTRRDERFSRPAAAVNRRKRHALSRAAIRYLTRLRRRPDHFRFDIVEVVGRPGAAPDAVRHLANAFPLDPAYRVRW